MPPTTPKTAMVLDVYLWNDTDPDDPVEHRVVTGVRERIEAKRHFKKPVHEVLSTGDEEAIVYLAWLGCRRHGIIDDDTDLDAFLDQLLAVDMQDDGAPADDGLTSSSDQTAPEPAQEVGDGGRDD